jgi:hypothetical protein
VHDESVELDEAALVEQEVEAFARRQLPLAVLRLEARRPAAQLRFGRAAFQQGHPLSHRHR